MNRTHNGYLKATHPISCGQSRGVTKEAFKAEVQVWADRIGVEVSELHIRSMKRKWGSCSTTGRVTFDTDLLKVPEEFRNEVIVHELLHLKVPNHGKVFKALLRAYLADSPCASDAK